MYQRILVINLKNNIAAQTSDDNLQRKAKNNDNMAPWILLTLDFMLCMHHTDCPVNVTPRDGCSSSLKPAVTLPLPLCPSELTSSTRVQTSISYIFITLPKLPLLSPMYPEPLVNFPACCLTLVPSPWPQPGPCSTCLCDGSSLPHECRQGRACRGLDANRRQRICNSLQQHVLPFPVYWDWNCHQYDWGWKDGQMCIHTLMSRLCTHWCACMCGMWLSMAFKILKRKDDFSDWYIWLFLKSIKKDLDHVQKSKKKAVTLKYWSVHIEYDSSSKYLSTF